MLQRVWHNDEVWKGLVVVVGGDDHAEAVGDDTLAGGGDQDAVEDL